MKTFFDAPNFNDFIEPIRISRTPRKSFPIRQDLSAIEYQVDYVQRMEFFRPSALGIHCPDDNRARLFNETNPKGMKNGLVEFTRSFATIPATRYEYEPGSFTFIEYQDSSGNVTRNQFAEQVVFRVKYSYIYSENPEQDLVLQTKYSTLDENGSRVYYVSPSTTPSSADYLTAVNAGSYIQAEASLVERWRGNIWQIRDQQIKAK